MKKVIFLLLAFSVAAGEQQAIHLTLWKTDPPALSVAWMSSKKLAQPKVFYRPAGSPAWQTQPASLATYPESSRFFYESVLSFLQPDTEYEYSVTEENENGPIHRFRTPPLYPSSFHFTACGDMGVTKAARQVIGALITERSDFHLHLGDLSYANGLPKIWDQWFQMVAPLASSIFYQPTLGNHERERFRGKNIGYRAYLTRFALPPPETYYAFNYGAVLFIALNSDDFTNRKQFLWLKKKLKQAQKEKKWIVIYQHHPPYSSSLRRGDSPWLIQTLARLYEKSGVDLVLTGHNHNYERTYPLKMGHPTTKAKKSYRKGEGTIYVVSGGCGAYLRGFKQAIPPRTAMRAKAHHYLSIFFSVKKGFLVKAIQIPDLQEMDAFTIVP